MAAGADRPPEATPAVAPPCRSLAEYITELVERLRADDPVASARLRSVVDDRRARINLDEEAVTVAFEGPTLVVEVLDGGGPGRPVHGSGTADRETVLDLLDGYVEVSDAVLDGRLRVTGGDDAVNRMLLAIEILLDGSARSPALQMLARDFRADPCREPPRPRLPAEHPRRTPWYPHPRPPGEDALLDRLGLLP